MTAVWQNVPGTVFKPTEMAGWGAPTSQPVAAIIMWQQLEMQKALRYSSRRGGAGREPVQRPRWFLTPEYENGHPEPSRQTLGKGVLELKARVSLLLWSSAYLNLLCFLFCLKKKRPKAT